jgi:maltose alpha-D-glucosyltransferase/alpha-amylase
MREHAAGATATLGASLARVPERLVARARAIVESPEALLARFTQLAALDPGCTRIRVHGDYHLGQVLYDKGDFIIVDFEGEPLRPIDERRRKQPALKDVAGMLRSFSYASYAALFAYAADRPADFDRLEPWTRLWQTWAASSFLRAYLAAARGASFVPRDHATLDAMLRAYLLDKAFYELVYELNNRPDWLAIPVWGLLGLV